MRVITCEVNEDTGRITGVTQAAPDASFDALVQHQREVVKMIRQDSNVDAVNSNIGGGASATGSGGGTPSNTGSLLDCISLDYKALMFKPCSSTCRSL